MLNLFDYSMIHFTDPWCKRHGLTRQQALSVAFDDASFNPQNPKKDLVTLRSLFAWSGQQNDFASYLMYGAGAENTAPQASTLVKPLLSELEESFEAGLHKASQSETATTSSTNRDSPFSDGWVDSTGGDPDLKTQRDMLAQGIGEAAVKAGIWREGVSATGPQLLMVLKDLASGASEQAPPRIVLTISGGNLQDVTADKAVQVVLVDHDTDGTIDAPNLFALPPATPDGTEQLAYIVDFPVTNDVAICDAVFALKDEVEESDLEPPQTTHKTVG